MKAMEWKNIYRGFIMGASDVVPGVSGGTIAVLLGIYDRLIGAINGLFTKEWKKHVSFLIPLGVGIVLAVLSLAKVMAWLLKHYQEPTFYFFLGLILGVIPFLLKEADVKNTFKLNHYMLLALAAIFIASLVFLNDTEGAAITDRSFSTYLLLFFSGFLGSTAMVLPGISGSFILLVIGVYTTVIEAIDTLDLPVIFVVGIGILLGIILMSKVINYFLMHFRSGTFAAIIGMVIGSVVVIFPGWPATTSLLLLSIGTFVIGLAAAYLLSKIEYQE